MHVTSDIRLRERKNDAIHSFLQILHRNIDSIDRRPSSSAHGNNVTSSSSNSSTECYDPAVLPSSSSNTGCGAMHVRCKDLRVISVEFPRADDLADVADSLEKLSAVDDVARSFPFFYRADFKVLEDGWSSFAAEDEFAKILRSTDPEWRISNVNKDFSVRFKTFVIRIPCQQWRPFFQVCRSYPSSVVVPSSVTDEQLIGSAAFRHGGRFPVLSYRHTTGVGGTCSLLP